MPRKKSYSLDHIVPAGGWTYTSGSAVCLPSMLKLVLSDKSKTLDYYHYNGTLLKTLPELLALIEAKGAHLIFRNQVHDEFLYSWDHSYVTVDYTKKSNAISISGYCTDPELYAFFKELDTQFVSKDKKNMIFSIVKDSSGNLTIKNLGNGSSPLIEENYNPEVIEGMQYVLEAFKKNPPVGRIAILAGEPGTGKTHLIRSFLGKLDGVFIIIPSNMVDSLDRPEFLPLLLRIRDDYEKPLIIVIEDGDVCLVPRKNDNISTIASMLNMSDGILGSIIDIKMVISTNASINDMDQAIMRPGRLCKKIHVGPLAYDQANKVYRRLSDDQTVNLPYSKHYTLAEVYNYFNTKDFAVAATPPTVRRSIGFGRNSEVEPDNRVYNKVNKE